MDRQPNPSYLTMPDFSSTYEALRPGRLRENHREACQEAAAALGRYPSPPLSPMLALERAASQSLPDSSRSSTQVLSTRIETSQKDLSQLMLLPQPPSPSTSRSDPHISTSANAILPEPIAELTSISTHGLFSDRCLEETQTGR